MRVRVSEGANADVVHVRGFDVSDTGMGVFGCEGEGALGLGFIESWQNMSRPIISSSARQNV